MDTEGQVVKRGAWSTEHTAVEPPPQMDELR